MRVRPGCRIEVRHDVRELSSRSDLIRDLAQKIRPSALSKDKDAGSGSGMTERDCHPVMLLSRKGKSEKHERKNIESSLRSRERENSNISLSSLSFSLSLFLVSLARTKFLAPQRRIALLMLFYSSRRTESGFYALPASLLPRTVLLHCGNQFHTFRASLETTFPLFD